LVAERRKLLSQIQADDCIEKMNQLLRSSVALDTIDPATGDLLPISRKYQLTVHDASYLELALRRQLPLATLDKPLQAAAKLAGVKSA
jgi:predicted nucleic acid-binding protein